METIVTAILFSVAGCFNGLEKSLWVMARGVLQALLVRLPLSYFLGIQPNAKLAMIGLAAPVVTIFFASLSTLRWLANGTELQDTSIG